MMLSPAEQQVFHRVSCELVGSRFRPLVFRSAVQLLPHKVRPPVNYK